MERRGRMMTILDAVAAVSMMAAALTLIWTSVRAGSTEAPPSMAVGGTASAKVAAENIENQGLTLRLAADGEKGGGQGVALVEFSDFECPFCARYARETLPKLRREFVDVGRVNYVFKHFPLAMHRQAFGAAEIAACAEEQSKFWDMHTVLFEKAPSLARPVLLDSAKSLGLNEDALGQCLKRIGPRIQRDEEEGRRLGVTATPTFLLGTVGSDGVVKLRRRLAGAYGYEIFKTALQELIDAQQGITAQNLRR